LGRLFFQRTDQDRFILTGAAMMEEAADRMGRAIGTVICGSSDGGDR